MNLDTIAADAFGRAITGLAINLPVADVPREAAQGLREAVILSPSGYARVPGRRLKLRRLATAADRRPACNNRP